jgi:hypothetical protein
MPSSALLGRLLGKKKINLFNKVVNVETVNRAGLFDGLIRREHASQAMHADRVKERRRLRGIFQNLNKN